MGEKEKGWKIKLVNYIVLVIVLLNLVLFGFRVINWIIFWGVIALAAGWVGWRKGRK